jgi:predicted aldo/keto reductase-like oxidoreductase
MNKIAKFKASLSIRFSSDDFEKTVKFVFEGGVSLMETGLQYGKSKSQIYRGVVVFKKDHRIGYIGHPSLLFEKQENKLKEMIKIKAQQRNRVN